jgi:hypothetical protein
LVQKKIMLERFPYHQAILAWKKEKYIYAYDQWMTTNDFVLVVMISFLQNTILQVQSYYVTQVSYSLLDSISQAMGHGICN